MKSIYYSVIILLFVFMISINSYAGNEGSKVLVVYYSWSEGKNTELLAKDIQKRIGADILEIDVVKPYPSDYNECVKKAKEEIQAGTKPKIKPYTTNLGQYDIIFVGTPNWWSTMAPPILTFLTNNDLSVEQ